MNTCPSVFKKLLFSSCPPHPLADAIFPSSLSHGSLKHEGNDLMETSHLEPSVPRVSKSHHIFSCWSIDRGASLKMEKL